MGGITIVAMVVTYFIGTIYTEPEVVVFIVMAVAVIIFAIGHAVVSSFDQMAQLNRSKSEFISITSHQLRSPLTSMKWALDLIFSGKIGRLEPKQLEFLQVFLENNERMIGLVNDLLNVNRIEAGRFQITPRDIDLVQISKEIVREMLPLATANNVDILVEESGLGLPKAMGDPEKIKMVIENLLDNAIRYSKRRGEVKIYFNRTDGEIKVVIRDHGVGIPEKQQKKIFDKFFRADNVMRYQTHGTGLGLFICKSIIDLSGGKIGFSSIDNKGSTFWFTLPIAKT